MTCEEEMLLCSVLGRLPLKRPAINGWNERASVSRPILISPPFALRVALPCLLFDPLQTPANIISYLPINDGTRILLNSPPDLLSVPSYTLHIELNDPTLLARALENFTCHLCASRVVGRQGQEERGACYEGRGEKVS